MKYERQTEEIMALSKKPTTGMKDILPEEMKIRDYVISVIKDTYGKFGFTSIETPCVENIANLSNKQGGDNEKLIFKILKRGEKLNVAEASTEEEVVDSGLRYDLTVPLVRFYSNNAASLPSPFKALQMGNVWRADRPQRGRYRQFMQCDIDILGEPSNLAEIELILATTTTLGKLEFKNFEIRINDRRVLKAMAAYSGFPESAYDSVFITLDKMDKIGMEGVEAELLENGFAKECVDKYLQLFKGLESASDGVGYLADTLGEFLDVDVRQNLQEIISSVKATKASEFEIVFDATLVRGMSYYTGTIFEIAMPEYGGSCGGGGRYDKMVGKFTGNDVPACGFSIGFERIIMLLMERGFKVPGEATKTAYLVEKGVGGDALCEVIAKAQEARSEGKQVLVARMNKNKKFQKEQLTNEGYTEFVEFYKEALKR
jgi:histidyl-tRNA synthetase